MGRREEVPHVQWQPSAPHFSPEPVSWRSRRSGIGRTGGSRPCPGAGSGTAAARGGADDYTRAQRDYWAFQPVQRSEAPPGGEWVRNPVDGFVLQALQAEGLGPAPEADRAALVRRAFLALVGLPPSPEEVREFVGDSSPQCLRAARRAPARLPHYGERWGRHWLDLARFAESSGFERDVTRGNAWRYRDYVIAALNADKPYDRFVREQVAGDELWPDSFEARIATAFNPTTPRRATRRTSCWPGRRLCTTLRPSSARRFSG